MANTNAAKIIPLKKDKVKKAFACKCGTTNSTQNYFCRICRREVHPTAEKKTPERCLHTLVTTQGRLHKHNYCPTCGQSIDTEMSLSQDDCGDMI
jgi:hypothetical protein